MSTNREKLALTGDTIRAALTRVEEDMKTNPSAWYPVLTSMVVALADKVDVVTNLAITSARAVQEYKKIFEALMQQSQASQSGTPLEAVAQQVPAAPVPTGPRTGADGTPLSDDQAAIEAQMDTAIGAMGTEQPAPPAQGSSLVPLRGGARPAPKRRVTAAGEVTDPAQLAAEELMDAATSES